MGIMVELLLVSDSFPMEEVYGAIGLDGELEHQDEKVFPTPSGESYVRQKNDCITYSTGYIETDDAEIPLTKIYEMLSEREKIIKDCMETYRLTAKFCIVINLTENPSVIFPKEFIGLVYRLDAKLEMDTYIH